MAGKLTILAALLSAISSGCASPASPASKGKPSNTEPDPALSVSVKLNGDTYINKVSFVPFIYLCRTNQ